MDSKNLQEIHEARQIIDELLPLVDQADRKFRHARNWGFVDILGGGLITDIIKHATLGSASQIMSSIQYQLQRLQRELSDIVIPTDFTMNTGTFSTLADFVFDGILADVWMQTKIMTSLDQIRELKSRLLILRSKLDELTTYR